MKIEPVKTYRTRYPDQYQAELNQLLQHRPNRWKSSGAAAILLCALAASQLAGCSGIQPQSESRKMNMAPLFGETVYKPDPFAFSSGLARKKQKMNVVPLGNYPAGDYFSLPESYAFLLSEEVALSIIQEELQNHGMDSRESKKEVDLNNGAAKWSFDLTISGAAEPVHAEFMPAPEEEFADELSERLALDLPDAPKEAAAALREKLCDVNDESTGVIFYANEHAADSEQNLREQVNEFVSWLKMTGLV